MIRLDKLLARSGFGTRKEVKKLIDIAYRDAQEILKQNIETLHAIATELMKKEKLSEEDFNKFFN